MITLLMAITFQFHPLTESQLPQLFEWLKLPHVSAWWREESVATNSYKKFVGKYTDYIQIDDVGPFVIYHDKKPIGYIAWYDAIEDPIRNEKYPERTYGMDVFVADFDYLGKGYGAPLIKQFIDAVIMPMNPSKLIIDPEATNTRAIHVYEKVGFKKIKLVQATDGSKMVTAQLMELDIS